MSYQYIQPTEEQKAQMQVFRDKFQQLNNEISKIFPSDESGSVQYSRGVELAKQKLEEVAFWVNKAITKNDR